MSQSTPADSELSKALAEFRSSLTVEQGIKFDLQASKPNSSAVLAFTAELDEENANRGRRCVSSRICGFLDSVQQFSTVVDTFVSSNPGIAALVWGSVRFAFLVWLLKALHLDVSKSTVDALTLSLAVWRPYEIEFGGLQNQLEKQCKEVEKEIRSAADMAAHLERQRQAKERSLMRKFRSDDLKLKLELQEAKTSTQQSSNPLYSLTELGATKEHLLEKLAPHPYLIPLKQARKRRLGRTCSWLVASDEFQAWQQDKQSSMFWCFGKMGCGKTVMSAHIIDNFLCDPRFETWPKAFFFCQFENAASLTARIILGCIVKQLLRVDDMPQNLTQQLSEASKVGFTSPGDLAEILKMVVARRPAILAIDGLDECKKRERAEVFEALNLALSAKAEGSKIFLSSRPHLRPEIDRNFKTYWSKTMGPSEVNNDIGNYINDALQEKQDTGQLKIGDAKLLKEIKDSLIKGAQSMMLWVYLQIEEICLQTSDHDVRLTMKNLPKDLPETYERALSRILGSQHVENIKRELQWVAAAKRPLSTSELREAIAIQPGQKFRSLDKYINDESLLISWCAGLVFLNEEEQTVQFVHPSVKAFLTSPPRSREFEELHFVYSDADLNIGKACVTYLNFHDFKTQLAKVPGAKVALEPAVILKASLRAGLNISIALSWIGLGKRWKRRTHNNFNAIQQLQNGAGFSDESSLQKLQTSYPFLAYASESWLLHTSNLENDDRVTWMLWEGLFASDNSMSGLPWPYNDWQKKVDYVLRWVMKNEHLALLSSALESRERPLNAKAQAFLVTEAASDHRLSMLQMALQRGNIADHAKNAALQIAAGLGHLDIVEALLGAGGNANAAPGSRGGRTALQAASEGGHLEVVERLLVAKANVNAAAGEDGGRTAIQAASEGGHLEVVERLLIAKADVNAAAGEYGGRTALQAASEGGQLEVIERLERG